MSRTRSKRTTALNKESAPTAMADVAEGVLTDSPLRNKRRTKVPRGTLGQKKQALPASSLPPSSPIPSSSNNLPIASSQPDGIPPQRAGIWGNEDAEDHWKENIDFSSQCYDDNGNFISPDQEDKEYETAAANASDPFGFFAVEEKLKVQRAKEPKETKPKADATSNSNPNPPRLPHRQRIGKRPISRSPSPVSTTSVRTEMVLSSPSPRKRSSERFGVRETDMDVDEEEPEEESPTRVTRSSKKARTGNGDQERLMPKLPRRRTRKPRRSYKDEEESEEVEEQPTPKRKPTRTRRKPRGSAKKEEEEEIDAEADEEREKERQARQEYFKKIQNYKLAKENVYVV